MLEADPEKRPDVWQVSEVASRIRHCKNPLYNAMVRTTCVKLVAVCVFPCSLTPAVVFVNGWQCCGWRYIHICYRFYNQTFPMNGF